MTYRFGVFEFRPGTADLWRDGIRVRIEPQPARALSLLLAKPGELVAREEMRAHLWGDDTHVDFDRGLAYCIGQVRTALGDSADNPRFVQTLPKRGYRFIAPVQSEVLPGQEPASSSPDVHQPGMPDTLAAPGASHRSSGWWVLAAAALAVLAIVAWTRWERAATDRPLIAVAVFDNETGSAEHDRLAATAADVMVDRLTALGPAALGVIGNTPSLRAPRAEREPAVIRGETGAGFLVIGQVQNDEQGVRLVVHLIRLDDGTHLWVTRVARPPDDLGGVEDVAAGRLADAVRSHVIERDSQAPRSTP